MLLATFTVVDTLDDANPGSLRWAIGRVDADTGPSIDAIHLAIPGTGPFTITPATSLPEVTHPVVIDGYTQPGSGRNTLPLADNAVLDIVLNGSKAYGDGLDVSARSSVISGLVIQQFGDAIDLIGGGGDVVSGDFLGTDATGQGAFGNRQGVWVESPGNAIGGTTPDTRNIVAASVDEGINLFGATGTLVEGNLVGLTASGTSLVAGYSDGSGILLAGATASTIGGTSAAARNVVGGQAVAGIQDNGSTRSLIEGNYVGTDVTGTVALPNGTGISVSAGAVGDVVGGAATGAGNLASGNTGQGIFVGGNSLVQGNRVGTDVSGAGGLGNQAIGVEIGGSGNTVGGSSAGAGNLISANGVGVLFGYDNLANNALLGNLVGTDSTGQGPLGNTSDGVRFDNGSSINTVGGTTAGAGNVIAFNGGAGIGLPTNPSFSQIGAEVLGNSIHDNAGLGIDLGDDGVTPNTPGGPHAGVHASPNELQNTPVLGAVATYGGQTYIQGSLNSTSGGIFTLQFYSNPTADPSGYGQGRTYLGQTTVTADASGNVDIFARLPLVVAAGQVVTATATDGSGDPSEFAANVAVAASSRPIYARPDAYFVDAGTSLVVAAPGVRSTDVPDSGGAFTSARVTPPSDGTLALNPDGSFTHIPMAGFSGVDTFTDDDIQGSVASNLATVTINVIPQALVVTNTNDGGPGSLRQAITTADQSTGVNTETIRFDLPGAGPFVISPRSTLPALTEPTLIDGQSQPGASANTLAKGDNAAIPIRLQGYSPAVDGLVLTAVGCTVRGLAIDDFAVGLLIDGAGDDTVIGSNFTGDGIGIDVEAAPSNTIGGGSPAFGDVFFQDTNPGILLDNSADDLIRGSYCGIDGSGAASGGLQDVGIDLRNSSDATIGGAASGQGNLVSGNLDHSGMGTGIFLESGSNYVTIQGNLIGTDATGTRAVPKGAGSSLTATMS